MSEPADAPLDAAAPAWVVYIILADDERLYTGISNDVQRRWQQHTSGRGAKFFRGRKPVALVFVEGGHDRASASRREAQIKKLSRPEKLALIARHDRPVRGWQTVLAGGTFTGMAETEEAVEEAKTVEKETAGTLN